MVPPIQHIFNFGLCTTQQTKEVFVEDYNRFSAAKMKFRQKPNSRELLFSLLDFLYSPLLGTPNTNNACFFDKFSVYSHIV